MPWKPPTQNNTPQKSPSSSKIPWGDNLPPFLQNGNLLVKIALGVVALWAISGFYIVDSPERGVVITLGMQTDVTEPGLHWHIPYPFEEVRKVNVSQIESWQKDFRMLTRDENIIELQIGVQYRISNPEHFLFELRSPIETLEQSSESALREVVGENLMDFVIQQGITEIGNQTQKVLQQALDSYKAGITVTSVNIKRAEAPEAVREAFLDASRAQEDQHRLVNEAEAYANDILPKARGNAQRLREEALGYKGRVIAQAEGDAARFTALVVEYKRAPDVTRRRLQLDMNERVLAATTKVISPRGVTPILYLPDPNGHKATPLAPTANLPAPLLSNNAPMAINTTTETNTASDSSGEYERSGRGGREP